MRYNIKFTKILLAVLIIGIISVIVYALFFRANTIIPDDIVKNINKVNDMINNLKIMLNVKSIAIDDVNVHCDPSKSSNGIFSNFKTSFQNDYNKLKSTLYTLKNNLQNIDADPKIKNTISQSVYDDLVKT